MRETSCAAIHFRVGSPGEALPAGPARSGGQARGEETDIVVQGSSSFLPLSLSGLRVAVSAAASGIGKTIADGFAQAGARVFICDIDEKALAAAGHEGVRADMRDPSAVERFIATALEHLGGLDVLVNNAGIAGPTKPLEDIAREEWEETLRIDLDSFFHAARRAIPALKAAGGGAIINMSSAAGRFGFPLRSPYAAAKWGVIGLTKTLAIELGPFGIRVNAILPGLVDGPRIRRVIRAKAEALGISENEQTDRALATTSLRCFVTPHDIANMVLYLASPFGATISGQALAIDGDMQVLL